MEAVLMADFDHKNVMWLIAIVIDDEMKPHVVLPFMEHGDLRDYVKNTTYVSSVTKPQCSEQYIHTHAHAYKVSK